MGQKIEYNVDLANKICHLTANGKSLRSICSLKDMPSKSTISNWIKQYPYFANNYEIAKSTAAKDKLTLKEAEEIEKNRSTGRPTKYSKELGTKICDLIAEGHTLTDIEGRGIDWPSMRTVNRWLSSESHYRPGFALQYERSKKLRADLYEDRLMQMLSKPLDKENDEKGIKRSQDIAILKWLIQDSRSRQVDLTTDDSNNIDMSKILNEDEHDNALELLEKIALAQAKRAK